MSDNPRWPILVAALMVVTLLAPAILSGCRSSDKSEEAAVAEEAEDASLEEAVVFVRDSDIWIIKPDGTGETRLTASPEPKAYPRLSPDGRSVAFTSFLSGVENTAGASVKLISLGGIGPERSVTTLTRGFAPAYMPDGRIAFLRTSSRESSSITYTWDDIYVMDAKGGGEGPLTDFSSVSDSGSGLRIHYLAPSPDGSEIAFVRGRRPDSRWVSTVSADGLETRYLTSPPLEPNPSGRGLADGSIALESSERVYLSHGSLNKVNSQSGHHLFLLDLAESSETLLSSGADDLNPTLSPGGNRIAFESAGIIFTAKESGLDPEALTRGSMPSWGKSIKLASGEQPVNGRIAFVRDCNVWICGPDHGGERRLTREEEPPLDAVPGTYPYTDWGGLAFSPGGVSLAAWKVGSGVAPTLVVIDVSSGVITDLGQELLPSWEEAGLYPWLGNVSWASESTLFCTTGTANGALGELRVARLELASGTITEVAAWAKDPAVSPDGKTLAYIAAPPESQGDEVPWGNSSPGNLMMFSFENGRSNTVSSNVIEAVFTPAGDRMVALYWNDPDTDLLLMDLEGNTVEKLDTVGPAYMMGHPAVSPDGRQVIYHAGEGITFGLHTASSLDLVEPGGGSFTSREWGRGLYPAWR